MAGEIVFKIKLLIKVEMHEVLFSLQFFHINHHYHFQEVKLYKNAREREKQVPSYIISFLIVYNQAFEILTLELNFLKV